MEVAGDGGGWCNRPSDLVFLGEISALRPPCTVTAQSQKYDNTVSGVTEV